MTLPLQYPSPLDYSQRRLLPRLTYNTPVAIRMPPRMRHMPRALKNLTPHAKAPRFSLIRVALHALCRRDAVGRAVDVDTASLVHAGRVVVRARPQVANVVGHPQQGDGRPYEGHVEVRYGRDGEAGGGGGGTIDYALQEGLVAKRGGRGVEDGGVQGEDGGSALGRRRTGGAGFRVGRVEVVQHGGAGVREGVEQQARAARPRAGAAVGRAPGLVLLEDGAGGGCGDAGLSHPDPRDGHASKGTPHEEDGRGWEESLVLVDVLGEGPIPGVHPAKDDDQCRVVLPVFIFRLVRRWAEETHTGGQRLHEAQSTGAARLGRRCGHGWWADGAGGYN